MSFGRHICGAILLCTLLSGCAALGGGPAPLDTYELTAASPEATGARRGRLQLLVAEPSALKSLDGQNIVIRPSASTVQYLSGAQWSDRLPRIVQAKLVESFQRSGRLGAVGEPGEGLAVDYQIVADIRAFGIRLDGGDRAEIEIFVKLLNDRNGVVKVGRSFTASAPVSGVGNDAFAAALNTAFARVSRDIVAWSLAAM